MILLKVEWHNIYTKYHLGFPWNQNHQKLHKNLKKRWGGGLIQIFWWWGGGSPQSPSLGETLVTYTKDKIRYWFDVTAKLTFQISILNVQMDFQQSELKRTYILQLLLMHNLSLDCLLYKHCKFYLILFLLGYYIFALAWSGALVIFFCALCSTRRIISTLILERPVFKVSLSLISFAKNEEHHNRQVIWSTFL